MTGERKKNKASKLTQSASISTAFMGSLNAEDRYRMFYSSISYNLSNKSFGSKSVEEETKDKILWTIQVI